MSPEPAKTPDTVDTAPEPDGLRAAAERRRPATSRILWAATYLAVVALMVARLPQIRAYVEDGIPEALEAVGDPELESLALSSALYIGIVLMALVVAFYLSLAVLLERKVFTARVELPGGLSFGLFYLIMTLCLVPINLFSLATGVVMVREHLWFYLYLLLIGVVSPFVYRRTWKGLPTRKIVILFVASTGMTALTAVG